MKDFVQRKDYGPLIGISALSAFISSLCCITPLVMLAIGVSSASFAAALDARLDSNYEAFFVLAGMLTLMLGIWLYNKRSRLFAPADARKTRLLNYMIIGFVFFLVSYLIIHDIIVAALEQHAYAGVWNSSNVYFGYKP
jgi:uncharacterized membrane protein YidH (DUF202 family)